MSPRFIRSALLLSLLCGLSLLLGGCFVPALAGAIGQNIERYKKIEVLAEYEGLDNETVAVVIQCEPSMLYEYPQIYGTMAMNISRRLQENVPGIKVLAYQQVMQWQYQTPSWSMLAYGEIAEELGVERVVLVEVYEFRLHPEGNRYLWDGACAGSVGVIERDGWDPDSFAKTWDISVKFPDVTGVGRESATESQIQMGVLAKFVDEVSWLFYRHVEDKYPDQI
ncbi:MAG: hypothetical protein VX641_07670 [Planctomycetota bacterium]|nr:hypothetical protein [Planctomycetota bacterium]